MAMRIENQAVMFALLCKYTVEKEGSLGNHIIQQGMIKYGKERGRRMAERAKANGDPIALWTNQAYGEWKPDYPGQMEFGTVENTPEYKTYISKCAWCDAWKKYDLLEYGREYCVNVDKAVYEGFRQDFKCLPEYPTMSWGGQRCVFNWTQPLSPEDQEKVKAKKEELGTSCMKDFEYHTAHIYHTISGAIRDAFPEDAEEIIRKATEDYIKLFGEDEFRPLLKYTPEDF